MFGEFNEAANTYNMICDSCGKIILFDDVCPNPINLDDDADYCLNCAGSLRTNN